LKGNPKMKNRPFVILVVSLTATVMLVTMFWLMGNAKGPTDSEHLAPDTLSGLNSSSDTPSISAIQPDSSPNDLDTLVFITGTGFTAGMTGTQVITLPTAALGNVEISDLGIITSTFTNGDMFTGVHWITGTVMTATVPWGMDPGTYTLTVANPDGNSASLPNAFDVYQGFGVWNTGDLYGGLIGQIVLDAANPETLYAPSYDVGLFRSQDGGASWSFQFAGHAGDPVIDPSSPSRIYLFGPWTIYRSDDQGATWTPLELNFPYGALPGADCHWHVRPFVHPATGSLYALACGGKHIGSGMLRSMDHGETWQPITVESGLTDTGLIAMAFHPTDPLKMYVGTSSGSIFQSLDGGSTWSFVSKPVATVESMAVNPFGNQELWVANDDFFGAPCEVVKSTNSQLTEWRTLLTADQRGCESTSINFSTTTPGTAYVAGLKTTDWGDTWSSIAPDDSSIEDIALHPSDPHVLYLADKWAGVYKTTDGGATWQVTNQGITALTPNELATPPNQVETVYAMVGDSWKGILKTTDGGASWQLLPIEDAVSIDSMLIDPETTTRIYVGAHAHVYISTDSGRKWTPSEYMTKPDEYNNCYHWSEALLAIPNRPGTLLAGVRFHCGDQWSAPGGIYRSTDYGETWTYIDFNQPISMVNALAYDPDNPLIVYLGTGEHAVGGTGIWRSTDAGVSWSRMGSDVPEMDVVENIAVEPGTQFVYAATAEGLFLSKDSGLTWAPAPDPYIGNIEQLLFAGDPPVFYAATLQGLIRSIAGGKSWQSAAGVLGQMSIYSLANVTSTDRETLYAGTTGGSVTSLTAQSSDLVNSTLVNAGVYRYTTLRPKRLYLPIMFTLKEQ
jgi:photosystem II stability/assembly factor-like uncharacterized protein